MNPWCTLLVSTSAVPSNPSIDTITEVVTDIRKQLDAPVIIMCDGIYDALRYSDQQMFEQKLGASEERLRIRARNYDGFKKKLSLWCKSNDVMMIIFDEHTHRAGMTRECLELVKTLCVLPIDHDTFMFNVDWAGIQRAMANEQVNAIRLYNFEQIHPGHVHLFKPREMIEGVPLMRTIQYGDHPNIQRTDFLRGLIEKYFNSGDKCFLEGKLWQVCHNAGWAGQEGVFKLWLYAPDNLKHFGDRDLRENIPTPSPIFC